ncbi:DNA sulfur modification protein DndE [Gemmatimonadota bacterium]
MIEHVRISKVGKDNLTILKRRTGIKTRNVLCRWALCVSLGDATPPSPRYGDGPTDLEISWPTFGGAEADLYWALVKERCRKDGLTIDDETVSVQFHLHLHRGLTHLYGDAELRSIESLLERVV